MRDLTKSVDEQLFEERYGTVRFFNTVTQKEEFAYIMSTFDDGLTCWAWFPSYQKFGLALLDWSAWAINNQE